MTELSNDEIEKATHYILDYPYQRTYKGLEEARNYLLTVYESNMFPQNLLPDIVCSLAKSTLHYVVKDEVRKQVLEIIVCVVDNSQCLSHE